MGLGGFGQGFASGLSAGSQNLESRAKAQALQQEALDQKLEYYQTSTQAVIKQIADNRAGAPQDSAELDNSTNAMADHVMDMIKGLTAIGGDKGRVMAMALGDQLTRAKTIPTQATAATNEMKAKYTAGAAATEAQTGVKVAPWKDASTQTAAEPGAAPQPGAGNVPAPAAPIPNSPITPAPDAGQQVAQGGPLTPPSAAPAAPMPDTGTAPMPAGAAPQGAPGITDQATAAPTPQADTGTATVKPLVNIQPNGVMDLGEVPPADVELIVAHPQLAAEFSKRYGIDPGAVVNGPAQPGSDPQSQAKKLMAHYIGGEESAFDKAQATQDAKDFAAQRKAYGDAKQLLVANLESRKKLKQGIVSGAFAGQQLAVMNVLDRIPGMLSKEDHEKLSRTQAYVSGIANQTAKIIKQFGAGTGLSDADREFAKAAAGGDISMTEDALTHILDLNSKMAIWAMSNPQLAQPDPDMQSLNPTGAE